MSRCVVVVDDDQGIRDMLGAWFRRHGWIVRSGEDGTSGLRALADQPEVNLVLLDIYLSGENGLDLLEPIRRVAPAVPIIVITGRGTIPLAVQAVKRGAEDFMTKPLDLHALSERAEKICSRTELIAHPVLKRIQRHVDGALTDPALKLGTVAEDLQLSPGYICRLYRQHLDTTFSQELHRLRLRRAKLLLTVSRLPVKEIASRCGYRNPRRLAEAFRRREGVSPRQYRKSGVI